MKKEQSSKNRKTSRRHKSRKSSYASVSLFGQTSHDALPSFIRNGTFMKGTIVA